MEVSSLVKRPWTFIETTHLPGHSTESPKTGFSSNQKSKGAGDISHWLKTLLSNLTDQLSLIPWATGERRELTLVNSPWPPSTCHWMHTPTLNKQINTCNNFSNCMIWVFLKVPVPSLPLSSIRSEDQGSDYHTENVSGGQGAINYLDLRGFTWMI